MVERLNPSRENKECYHQESVCFCSFPPEIPQNFMILWSFFPPVDPAHSPEAGSLGLWYLAFWVGSRLVRESISISRVDTSRLPPLQTFLRPPPPTTDTCAATYMWIHIPQKCTHTCTHAHCKTHQVAGTCMIKVPIFCDLTNSTCLCKGPWRPVPIHIRLDSNPH